MKGKGETLRLEKIWYWMRRRWLCLSVQGSWGIRWTGRGKFWFVVVIFSKIDWSPGQGHGKILKNAGPPKTKNLFGNTWTNEFFTLHLAVIIKIGFGMERMPCGQFEANAVFFRIGVVVYNTWRLFVLKSLDKTWHRHQVQTIRWRLYQVAGKIVYHGG